MRPLINACLAFDPRLRPTAADIVNILELADGEPEAIPVLVEDMLAGRKAVYETMLERLGKSCLKCDTRGCLLWGSDSSMY